MCVAKISFSTHLKIEKFTSSQIKLLGKFSPIGYSENVLYLRVLNNPFSDILIGYSILSQKHCKLIG